MTPLKFLVEKSGNSDLLPFQVLYFGHTLETLVHTECETMINL